MTSDSTGHHYTLDNFENPNQYQNLDFIEKRLVHETFVTVQDGTTTEEVLKALIDRTQKLNAKAPCRENSLAITKMEEALMWFEKRTTDRKLRRVEGTPNS